MSHFYSKFFSLFKNNAKSKLRSLGQRGVSLVELLVVVGIMAVIGAGLAAMMMNANKETRSVAAKSDFSSLVSTLQSVFNNSGSCLVAFGGSGVTALGPFPQTLSLDIAGAPFTVGNYGTTLNITKFEFTERLAAGGVNQWVASLKLEADRSIGTQTAVGGNILSHTFRIVVSVNAGNMIVGCSGQYDSYWVPTTSNQNNIVYSGGNVGIGTNAPASLLDVNGTTLAMSYMYRSDLRLKQNIREIPSSLDRALKLHGIVFDWKNKANLAKGEDQLGFIAQEVEEVFPELVTTNVDTGVKAVAYGNLLAPLVEAFKEQQQIILKQQLEIAEIKRLLSNQKQARQEEW